MMHPSIAELQQAYARGDLVVFAGAGISAGAGLPSWNSLTTHLIEHAQARGVAPDLLDEARELATGRKFIDAMSALKDALGGAEFCTFIERQLNDELLQIPKSAEAIALLSDKLRAILTTNIDHVLERALAGKWPTISKATSDIAQRRGILLKIHGTLLERETWVFTRADYDRAMYADPRMGSAFSALFHGRTLLFVGYGLADDDFDRLLARVRAFAGDQPPRHFALVPSSEVGSYRRRLLESSGVSVITYSNDDGSHKELPPLIEAIAQGPGQASARIADAFPTAPRKVPGATEQTQRIVDERPPHWELRLFSRALSDELYASSSERRDMTLGVSFDSLEAKEPHEALSWIATQFGSIARTVEILSNLVNLGLNDAMGPSGEPGDPEKLVYVANRIGQAYREAIAWTLRWQRLHTDDAFARVIALGQSAGTRLVHQIEDWNGRIANVICEILDEQPTPPPGTVIDLSVVIDLPQDWEENMQSEFKRLGLQFGG
jgi:hypothetical protein